MPKLIVPSGDNGSSNVQPMSISGVADSIASGAEIGKVEQTQGAAAIRSGAQIGAIQQNLGNWQSQYGNELFNRGAKTMNNAIYNLVQSNAVQDYNRQAKDHVAQALTPASTVLDNYAKANTLADPSAVPNELDNISNNVIQSYGDAIHSPEDKAKFVQSIQDLNTSRKTLTAPQTRTAQLDLAHQSLQQSLDTDIQSGMLDSPENIGFYANQGLGRITAALSTGSISTEQAATMGEKLRKGLYYGTLAATNQTNPVAVSQLLQTKSAQDLNLSDIEYANLKKQNKFALADTTTLGKIQYQAQNEIDNAKSMFVVGGLQKGIAQGTVQTAQIVDAYDSGKISYPQFVTLQTAYNTAAAKTNKAWSTRADISAAVQANQVLAGFSPNQIDDSYQNKVRSMAQDGNLASVSLADKTDIATHYKGPVSTYANEIKYRVQTGDMGQIKDAVYAYNQIQSQNPLAVSDLSKDPKLTAYISALSHAYKYNANMTQENIQSIKDSIYNVDGRTATARMNDFSKESSFNNDNIKSTIAGLYAQGDPWYRSADHVPDDVVNMIKPLFRDAYRITGDVDTAKEMVANQTKSLIGHSTINDVAATAGLPDLSATHPVASALSLASSGLHYIADKTGLSSGSIMAFPPEQVYASKGTPQELRAVINTEAAPFLPQGMNPNRVLVGSDDKTIEQARRGVNPTYYLYYLDDKGHQVLLPKRWGMDSQSDAVLNNIRQDTVQGKVAPSAQSPDAVPTATNPELQKYASPEFYKTKGFGQSPIMDQNFVDKLSNTTYVKQITSHYPGDEQSRPIVGAAITKMLGADNDSWRVAQSLKLVNSVLVNNSDPKTFMQFGKATTSPSAGDIVVTDGGAGLFGGYQHIDGELAVKMISMKSGQLSATVVSAKDVKGYRSLPTPENFYQQSNLLNRPAVPHFNPYTGEAARSPTGQERFNPYNMTTDTNLGGQDKATGFNPYTGQNNAPNGFNDKLNQAVASAPQDQVSNGANSYNIGAKTEVVGGRNSGTWWDSVVSKLDKDHADNNASTLDIPIETQNGKLSHPIIDPTTGKYTDNVDNVKNLVGSLKQNLQSQTGDMPKKHRDLIVEFIKNTYRRSKDKKKFSKDELNIISQYLGNSGDSTNGNV